MATLTPRDRERAEESLLPVEFSLGRVVEEFEAMLLEQTKIEALSSDVL